MHLDRKADIDSSRITIPKPTSFMAVHLDDFQIILGMEFLNAARALAILFYTINLVTT